VAHPTVGEFFKWLRQCRQRAAGILQWKVARMVRHQTDRELLKTIGVGILLVAAGCFFWIGAGAVLNLFAVIFGGPLQLITLLGLH
jgi:hypothetical protein